MVLAIWSEVLSGIFSLARWGELVIVMLPSWASAATVSLLSQTKRNTKVLESSSVVDPVGLEATTSSMPLARSSRSAMGSWVNYALRPRSASGWGRSKAARAVSEAARAFMLRRTWA